MIPAPCCLRVSPAGCFAQFAACSDHMVVVVFHLSCPHTHVPDTCSSFRQLYIALLEASHSGSCCLQYLRISAGDAVAASPFQIPREGFAAVMVSASVEFITTRRAVKVAAVEIDAQQLIAHLQSRFGGQVSHGHINAGGERVAGQDVVQLGSHLQRRLNAQVNLSMGCPFCTAGCAHAEKIQCPGRPWRGLPC